MKTNPDLDCVTDMYPIDAPDLMINFNAPTVVNVFNNSCCDECDCDDQEPPVPELECSDEKPEGVDEALVGLDDGPCQSIIEFREETADDLVK